MNRLIIFLSFFIFLASAHAQNNEGAALNKAAFQEWNSSEFSLLNKKIPLVAKDATLQQLSDLSKPNKKEKIELEKYIEFRKRIGVQGDALTLKNARPAGLASDTVNNRINLRNKIEILTSELYNGKINFGDFNKKRSQIYYEFDLSQAALNAQYKRIADEQNAKARLENAEIARVNAENERINAENERIRLEQEAAKPSALQQIMNGVNAAYTSANPPNAPIPNLTPGVVQGRPFRAPNRQLNCTTTYLGNQANTTCN